ncbi:MAG: thioredoxin family protein [Clostridiales bacterium]|nr:thioredoxin family protein [Clostridiales bacterium]
MINLTKDNFASTIASGKTLIGFGAQWCGYCRMMEPIVAELAVKDADKATIAKVDADAEPTLIQLNQITAFPTFVMFKDGVEVGRSMGVQTIEALESMIG